MSAKDEILKRLQFAPRPLAVHELKIDGYNENNLATRCAELAKDGKIIGSVRPGFNFKEWQLLKVEQTGQVIFL
jgi:hypothetical protein